MSKGKANTEGGSRVQEFKREFSEKETDDHEILGFFLEGCKWTWGLERSRSSEGFRGGFRGV